MISNDLKKIIFSGWNREWGSCEPIQSVHPAQWQCWPGQKRSGELHCMAMTPPSMELEQLQNGYSLI